MSCHQLPFSLYRLLLGKIACLVQPTVGWGPGGIEVDSECFLFRLWGNRSVSDLVSLAVDGPSYLKGFPGTECVLFRFSPLHWAVRPSVSLFSDLPQLVPASLWMPPSQALLFAFIS